MTPEIERTVVLSRHTHVHAIHSLRAMLPPPVSDDPDAWIRRDSMAMAQVAGLAPVGGDEVALAVVIAATTAHAGDVLRLANAEPAWRLKCLAQCARTLREANASRSLLRRAQAARLTRDADNAAADAAAWTEHAVLGDMLKALGRKPNGEPDTGAECAAVDASASACSPQPDAPDGDGPPARVCPYFDTLSHDTGNETTVRHVAGPVSAADESPASVPTPFGGEAHDETTALPRRYPEAERLLLPT